MSAHPSFAARNGGSGPVVEIRGLSTVFDTPERRIVVHENLDLSVQAGEVLSIVGGSGTGKTVLLRQMLGLEHPAAGSIRVLGQPAAEMGKKGAASRVGMLFQHGALFSAFTVLENIAFPLRELKTLPSRLVREAAVVKLQMVGLKPEDGDKMPADLSGGMIKRAALARALVMDPPLLLLDEPTAHLDPATEAEVLDSLRRLALGRTVILTSHSAAAHAFGGRRQIGRAHV